MHDTAGEVGTSSKGMYSYGPLSLAKARRPTWTYIQQLFEDTWCSPENLPKAMNDRERLQERVGVSVLMVRLDDDNDDD